MKLTSYKADRIKIGCAIYTQDSSKILGHKKGKERQGKLKTT